MTKVIVFDQVKGDREPIDVFVGSPEEVEAEMRKTFAKESAAVPAGELYTIIANVRAVFGKHVEVWMKVD